MLMPVPHSLQYCSFVTILKLFPVSLPTLFFFTVLAILDLLHLVKILGSVCQFCREISWDFDRDCIESINQFGKYCILAISVQFSRSVVSDSLWPQESQHTRSPCPSPTPSLPKPMSIESVMPSSHLILCHPLLLLPPILPSIRVFSNESTLHMMWPKYWSFSFSISPSNEHPGLISFRIDWLDLLAIQGTLKSLLQHHRSKASILRRSAFFTVQLSHPYMTTGK